MSRAVLFLTGPAFRAKAIDWIARAKDGTRVEFRGPIRSKDQNAAMWARLTELSEQLAWHGQKYTAEDWKDYFMHALKRARWMPCEDGGMVPIGMRTSELSREEMGDLLAVIDEFAARHGVQFKREAA